MLLRSRVAALAVIVTTAVAALGVQSGAVLASAASPTVTPAVGVPTPGAGAPSGTTFDLGSVGYEASELFVAGTASSYHSAPAQPFTSNGIWTIEADAAPTPTFKTRLQVYRPSDPAEFSGVVIVEWLNVTNQSDSAADWILAHNEMIREGHVYVGATVQAVGVNATRATPTRRATGLLVPISGIRVTATRTTSSHRSAKRSATTKASSSGG